MIVPDASVLAHALAVEAPGGPLRRRLAAETELHVPHLVDLEVLSTFRSLVSRGSLSNEWAMTCISNLADLAIVRYPHEGLTRRIWELRDNLTPYDAAYVALAEALGAILVTADAPLSRAPGPRCPIELVP